MDSPPEKKLHDRGYIVLPPFLGYENIRSLSTALAPITDGLSSAGKRGIANAVDQVKKIAHSEGILSVVRSVLGSEVKLARSIYFNKTPDTNWKVSWHQDVTIAVKEKLEVEGYSPWSMKDGVVHVQPPESVLQRMLTLRIHLDDADNNNGALYVSPGTHSLGKIRPEDIKATVGKYGEVCCKVEEGGVMLFRPLLLHRSGKMMNRKSRRVVHLEYTAASLDGGLVWSEVA